MNPNREFAGVSLLVEPRRLELSGTHLAYFETGLGPTKLLIPALDEGSFVYALQIENPADLGRVVVFDNVGSGASDRPAIEYRPRDYLRFASRLLDKLVDEPAVICAHADAAVLALALAIVRSPKVAGIILVNPDLPAVLVNRRSLGGRNVKGVLTETPLADFVYGIRVSAGLRARLWKIARAGKKKHREFEPASLKSKALGTGFRTIAIRRRNHVDEWSEWAARIGEITVPVRVVVGERVRSRHKACVAFLSKELSDIDFIELEGAGRYPMIEKPDEFIRVLSSIGPAPENARVNEP